ncbi:xylulose kinase-like [Sesbania bispinosa]|nr:xylulose kinase-like [Sesbania bispinosa]
MLASLERENEGPAVHFNALSKHLKKEGEGNGGNSGFAIASDHGVPHVSVGFLDSVEENMSIANVSGIGECAEREDPAGGERVGNEAGAGHVCLNLLQLSHAGT